MKFNGIVTRSFDGPSGEVVAFVTPQDRGILKEIDGTHQGPGGVVRVTCKDGNCAPVGEPVTVTIDDDDMNDAALKQRPIVAVVAKVVDPGAKPKESPPKP